MQLTPIHFNALIIKNEYSMKRALKRHSIASLSPSKKDLTPWSRLSYKIKDLNREPRFKLLDKMGLNLVIAHQKDSFKVSLHRKGFINTLVASLYSTPMRDSELKYGFEKTIDDIVDRAYKSLTHKLKDKAWWAS